MLNLIQSAWRRYDDSLVNRDATAAAAAGDGDGDVGDGDGDEAESDFKLSLLSLEVVPTENTKRQKKGLAINRIVLNK